MLKKFNSIRWITNLAPPLGKANESNFSSLDNEFSPRPKEKLSLKENYSPDRYPRFDTFDAIEVGKVEAIPLDFEGLMAVPITFLDRWDHDQFRLVGILKHGVDGEWDFAKPILNGKEKYVRLLIQKI